MIQILGMENKIQNYSWGSKTFISKLMGNSSPSDQPQAEVWMGAHPNASSTVIYENKQISLKDLIEKYPEQILGDKVAKKYSNRLPFLFKILAAGEPLSIQVHPSLEQAKDGFRRENEAGILLTAPNRNYKDDNHKPEIICALTPFIALKGFRKIKEIILFMKEVIGDTLLPEIKALENEQNAKGLKIFFESIMNLDDDRKKKVINNAVRYAKTNLGREELLLEWIIKLNEDYPGDIGVLSPLYLNLVQLKPGEALFLDAGELHAYMQGFGIELMANSDNVLRGGLTAKHIDRKELIKALDFGYKKLNVIKGKKTSKNEVEYKAGSKEFVLSNIIVSSEAPYINTKKHNAEILICTEGEVTVFDMTENNYIDIMHGQSFLVPASSERYKIEGDGVLYKASVPF